MTYVSNYILLFYMDVIIYLWTSPGPVWPIFVSKIEQLPPVSLSSSIDDQWRCEGVSEPVCR